LTTSGPQAALPPLATVAGLYERPCDPLFLAVRDDDRPLHGLTGEVDWRLGGRLSALVRARALPEDAPLLLPATPLLPAGRLVLWRAGHATPERLAAATDDLAAAPAGLCPDDFDLSADDVRAAFGARAVVLYRPA
jgi:hypothetical protein